jgi:hypothetical protein
MRPNEMRISCRHSSWRQHKPTLPSDAPPEGAAHTVLSALRPVGCMCGLGSGRHGIQNGFTTIRANTTAMITNSSVRSLNTTAFRRTASSSDVRRPTCRASATAACRRAR